MSARESDVQNLTCSNCADLITLFSSPSFLAEMNMTRIHNLEEALTHLTEAGERRHLTSAEHRLIRQAQEILSGERDVPLSYGSRRTRADQQRAARQQQQTRSALRID